LSPIKILQGIENVEIAKDYFDEDSIRKVEELERLYASVAQANDCFSMKASNFANLSQIDGIHMDETSHNNLAKGIYKMILKLTEEGSLI